MGVDVRDNTVIIDDLVANLGSDFIAEVFIEELDFLLDENIFDTLIVRNQGMNTRHESRDVLSVETKYIPVNDEFKEYRVLNLSRNSIYHQLPEILFYPLSIESKKGNPKDVVSKIKANREKEQGNLDFFSLFDTELFKESVKINNRSLNFLFEEKSKKHVVSIFRKILGTDLQLSDTSFYKFFIHLCSRSEECKENLPKLEELIKIVLDLNVKMSYVPHKITVDPFLPLGESKLGLDFGLSGEIYSEVDDIKLVILLDSKVDNYEILRINMERIHGILGFFILSQRKVYISCESKTNTGMVLSESFLGYDFRL